MVGSEREDDRGERGIKPDCPAKEMAQREDLADRNEFPYDMTRRIEILPTILFICGVPGRIGCSQ